MVETSRGQFINEIITTGAEKSGVVFTKIAKSYEKVREKCKVLNTEFVKFDKVGNELDRTTRSIIKPTSGLELASKKFGKTQAKVRRGAEDMNAIIDEEGNLRDVATNEVIEHEKALKGIIQANRRFKMELLSVMFFGMAISRTFGGMVKQVMELTGVFDVWKAVLTMILLPILLPFSKVLIDIMFWILQHPTVGKFVGWFIIFAATLGAAMMFAGQLLLGINGLLAWTVVGDLLAWFGKGGFWWLLAAAGVTYLAIDLYSEIKEGDIVNVIADILGLAGFLLPVPPVAKGALFAVAAAVIFFGKGFGAGLTWKEFVLMLGFATTAGWKIGGLWGAVAAAGIAVIFGLALNWDSFKTSLENAWTWVKGNKFAMIAMSLVSAAAGFGIGYLKAGGGAAAIPSYIGGGMVGIIPTELLNLITSGYSGQYQYGGYVPRTGMYQLHAGETVTPSGGFGGGGMTINVNAAISSEMDVKRLADRISIEMGRNLEREYSRRAI